MKATLRSLNAADRCDQCQAQAYVAVAFRRVEHELLFCAHHFTKHEAAIKANGGRVLLDQRPLLNGSFNTKAAATASKC